MSPTAPSASIRSVSDEHQNQDEYDLTSQPNDAFFKDFFSDIRQATKFFKGHLPEPVASLAVWESLTLVPGSFVKGSLQQAHSDLLFSLKTTGDREVSLYLLFEHQTSIDPAMPLRLLAYIVEILQKHHRQFGLPLPPVIGFVLNQGPDRWTVSQRFEDMFQMSELEAAVLHDYVPKFQHALLDLTQIDPDQSEADVQLRVALQLMKLAREMKLMQFFEWLSARFDSWMAVLPDPFLRKILIYALNAENDLDVETIAHKLEKSSHLNRVFMSTAEKLIAKGKAEGKAEGKAKGVWIGKVQLLEEMLSLESSSGESLANLSVEDLESRFHELQKQYQAVFKAKS